MKRSRSNVALGTRKEPACRSVASRELASARGDTEKAIDLYRRSLAAFEAIGDRAEEARVLSETAWTHLANHDPVFAHETFLESVRAHTDVGSVRGVGLSLIGLAATEAVEHRPEIAVQIAAAAEVYAGQEGIAVLYDEDAPGRAYLDRAEPRSLPMKSPARRRPAAGSRSRKHSIWPGSLKTTATKRSPAAGVSRRGEIGAFLGDARR